MPEEKQVTITITDEGHVDLEQFAHDTHLSQVKQLVDGLRGSVEELKPQAAKASELEKLGTPDQIADWKKRSEEAQALRDRISELEEGATMTDEEKKELEQLREKAQKLGDLDPDEARQAVEFKQRTEKEQQLAEAFEAAGLNPKAALRLDGVRNLETRVQTEQKDGKSVKVPQVKVGDEWQPLNDHVEAEYSDFLPVLKPQDDAPKGTSPVDSPRPREGKGEPQTLSDAVHQALDK